MGWKFALELVLLISLTLSNSSEARNVKNLHSSAVIVGRVLCNTCFQDDFSGSSHFISGATVSVECKDAALRTEGETNEQGEFKVHLPLPISKHEEEIKGCQVRLLKSNDPYCAVASAAASSAVHLESRKQGIRLFSAGLFTFKPLKQPDLCNQQPSNKVNTQMGLLDPIPQLPTEPKDPVTTFKESIARPQFLFPPVIPPVLPSPPPALGGIPLPPNPLQPPPLVPLPPNPLQPPSPPSFGLPGLPGLTPSPPPPAPVLPLPPGLPIPPVVPGLPVPPVVPGLPIPPGVPGVPAVPGLPIPPVVPGVPAVPGLPIPPGVPAVPGLPIPPGVPSLPLPPGLPIPPVVPGVPPAKKVSP